MDDTVRRKIIVYIATSADGFIAWPKDSVDRAGSQERSVVAARLEEVAVVRLHYLVRGGGRSVA